MVKDEEELHRLQRAFREVLDAYARPGTVHRIEAMPENAARPAEMDGCLETAVRLLVDQAVTFCVADAAPEAAAAYIADETHARRRAASDADYLVVLPRGAAEDEERAVREARPGTPVSPETGATVVVGCSRLAAWPAQGEAGFAGSLHVVEVRGPGVRDANRFLVDRADWVAARAGRRDEFPCGVEIMLVDGEGRMVAVPRSAAVTVVPKPAPVPVPEQASAQEVC